MANPSDVDSDQSVSFNSVWDADVIELLDSDDDDITRAHVLDGKDPQGIEWERLQNSREDQRAIRLKEYPNYLNCKEEVEAARESIKAEAQFVNKNHEYFAFEANVKRMQFTIVHFQLRNLLWATSNHDVYVMHDFAIVHWDLNSRAPSSKVLDLKRGIHAKDCSMRPASHISPLPRVQISTCCVAHNLVAAGGFNGELVVRRLTDPDLGYNDGDDDGEGDDDGHGDDDGEGDDDGQGYNDGDDDGEGDDDGGHGVLQDDGVGDNDGASTTGQGFKLFSLLREKVAVQAKRFAFLGHRQLWHCPGVVVPVACKLFDFGAGAVVCAVVGGPPRGLAGGHALLKASLRSLKGHYDYSFAATWHPHGTLLATGNQDQTVRLWDVRKPSQALMVLRGEMGAVRSLRFSGDGRFLASAEPADFVTIYDVASNFEKAQQVDLFGEIAGIAFSPESDRFFVGIADITYPTFVMLSRGAGSRCLTEWTPSRASAA
eukprot:jgi/Botrbrau1/22935/Bobra.0030s0012.1